MGKEENEWHREKNMQGIKETKFPALTACLLNKTERDWGLGVGVRKRTKGSGEGPEVLVIR